MEWKKFFGIKICINQKIDFQQKDVDRLEQKLLKKEADEIILSNLAEGNLYIKDE